MGKTIVVTSLDEMPREYLSKFSEEVLEAYFEAHHTLTLKNTKTGMRFYCDDGRRAKRNEHIQNFLYDKMPGSTIREGHTSILPGKLKKACDKQSIADFLNAGYLFTIQRSPGAKDRYYLPDGNELLSNDDLNKFLCSKRPQLSPSFFHDVAVTAAKTIPGVGKRQIYVDTPENENTANLCMKIEDNVYTLKILPYVTYAGAVESKLFDDFYQQCTALQEQNKLDFAKNHNLDILKEIAYSVLSDDNIENITSLLKRFRIEYDVIDSILVKLEDLNSVTGITICTSIKLSNHKNIKLPLSVPYSISEETLQKKYRNIVETDGRNAVAKIQSFYVSPNSPIHALVSKHCETVHEVKKTYTKGNIVIDGVVHPTYKKQQQEKAYPVDNIIVPSTESDINLVYCNIANMVTIQLNPETGAVKECVFLTFSPLEDFLDKTVNSLIGFLSEPGKAIKCHATFELIIDYTQRRKYGSSCYAKLTDTSTDLMIANFSRYLLKRTETDVARSREEIPDNFIDAFLNTKAAEMTLYKYSCNEEWLNTAYSQIENTFGPLGYAFCSFFVGFDDNLHHKTDVMVQFLNQTETDYKKTVIKEGIEQFLSTTVPTPKGEELYLFTNETAYNHYQSYDVFKPTSKYLLKGIAAKYDPSALALPLDHIEYLTKEAQHVLLDQKCQSVTNEEEAF